MKKERLIVLIGLLIIVIIIGLNFLISCRNYFLDEAHRIGDKTKIPQGTWYDMKSPNDNSTLEYIGLGSDGDPRVVREDWKTAYYSKTENIFWVVHQPYNGWYGPFEGRPKTRCLT